MNTTKLFCLTCRVAFKWCARTFVTQKDFLHTYAHIFRFTNLILGAANACE